jgi:hypothetical protein
MGYQPAKMMLVHHVAPTKLKVNKHGKPTRMGQETMTWCVKDETNAICFFFWWVSGFKITNTCKGPKVPFAALEVACFLLVCLVQIDPTFHQR